MFSEGWPLVPCSMFWEVGYTPPFPHVHLTHYPVGIAYPSPDGTKNTPPPPPGREGTWDQRYPPPRKDMGPGIPSLLPQELRLVQAGCTHATGMLSCLMWFIVYIECSICMFDHLRQHVYVICYYIFFKARRN